MRSYILILSLVLMSCATDGNRYQVKREDFAQDKAKEVQHYLKNVLQGKDYYSTTPQYCHVKTAEQVEAVFNDKANEALVAKMTSAERIAFINQKRQQAALENTKAKVNAHLFESFAKLKIEDIRVHISSYDIHETIRSANESKTMAWAGGAQVYFTVAQNGKKFLISSYNDGLDVQLQKGEQDVLFDMSSGFKVSHGFGNTFNCFSKVNPIARYKLTKKELGAIAKNKMFAGMSEAAVILMKGHPQQVNIVDADAVATAVAASRGIASASPAPALNNPGFPPLAAPALNNPALPAAGTTLTPPAGAIPGVVGAAKAKSTLQQWIYNNKSYFFEKGKLKSW